MLIAGFADITNGTRIPMMVKVTYTYPGPARDGGFVCPIRTGYFKFSRPREDKNLTITFSRSGRVLR